METERLILHAVSKTDFQELKKYSFEELVPKTALASADEVEEDFKHLDYRFFEDNDGFKFWYVAEKQSGNIIGQIDIHSWVKRHNRAEIGYMFRADYRGNGYATEAAKEVLSYAFNELKLNRVEAYTAPDNLASQKVLLKLGFFKEGFKKQHFRFTSGEYSDSMVFGLVLEDYKQSES